MTSFRLYNDRAVRGFFPRFNFRNAVTYKPMANLSAIYETINKFGRGENAPKPKTA